MPWAAPRFLRPSLLVVPTTHALRTERYKYIEYEGRDPELYDLSIDPGEYTNLIGTDEGDALLPALRAELRQTRTAAKDGRPTPRAKSGS
ncbi:MAG: DUF4976 domain-containing protein [Candidatus Binatia bacterium]|nr:DUF4976 domain-containing protein [Candidatus Binatia bacterium]